MQVAYSKLEYAGQQTVIFDAEALLLSFYRQACMLSLHSSMFQLALEAQLIKATLAADERTVHDVPPQLHLRLGRVGSQGIVLVRVHTESLAGTIVGVSREEQSRLSLQRTLLFLDLGIDERVHGTHPHLLQRCLYGHHTHFRRRLMNPKDQRVEQIEMLLKAPKQQIIFLLSLQPCGE